MIAGDEPTVLANALMQAGCKQLMILNTGRFPGSLRMVAKDGKQARFPVIKG